MFYGVIVRQDHIDASEQCELGLYDGYDTSQAVPAINGKINKYLFHYAGYF